MHTNQACNLLCYEVISNCIPCLKVKTCCLVFYHALTLYELDVHWMKSFFVSLSAQHRVSGLKLRIKEPNLKTVLIKSMLFMNEVRWKQVFCSLSSNVYHQKTLSKYLLLEKTAIFWCIFLFDRKIKVRLKDQAAEEEEEVGHNKEWGKERKKKWEWEVWQIPLSRIGIFCQITPVGPRVWLSGMQPAVYSYLAFSLIEAIAKFDQALKSIR